MDVILGSNFVLLVSEGDKSLFCCRNSGRLTAYPVSGSVGTELLEEPQCLGLCHGLIGVVNIPVNAQCQIPTLILISDHANVAKHPFQQWPIYRITRATAIPLIPHGLEELVSISALTSELGQQKSTSFSSKLLKNVKTATIGGGRRFSPDDCKTFRGNLEEISKLFNSEGGFYHCPKGDLTRSIAKLKSASFWDERFFWNFDAMRDVVNDVAGNDMASHWIRAVIQGFVGQRQLELPGFEFQITVTLISRRSVKRAGARYIKRGIDEDGSCANFVESEQILSISGHNLAFVQVRGSVPLFWSQRGYKYRPPLRIDRTKSESLPIFKLHLSDLIDWYGEPMILVNLIDQIGRENCLGESFLDHIIDFDSESVVYVAFDFHRHCRGMKMEKIGLLLSSLFSQLHEMRFSWLDTKGELICNQKGVFRVNCIDCLDRTNVVQNALSMLALSIQLGKLGILSPEELEESFHGENLPLNLLLSLQQMWADNGDCIAQQYAGTGALKADMTRSGQRKLAGLVKDGYKSASRYYVSHMRDFRRQWAVDRFLGVETSSSETDFAGKSDDDGGQKCILDEEEDRVEVDERLRQLVQHCQKFFLPDDEMMMAGWALVDADPATGRNDFAQNEMDTIVLLSRRAFYVTDYDEELDKFVECRRIQLDKVCKLEVGPMAKSGTAGMLVQNFAAAGRKSAKIAEKTCLKLYYDLQENEKDTKPFFLWRPAGTRLFNNMAIPIKSEDESTEYINAIGEQFKVALEIRGVSIELESVSKIPRTKSVQPAVFGSGKKRLGLFSTLSGATVSLKMKFSEVGRKVSETQRGPVVPRLDLGDQKIGTTTPCSLVENSSRIMHSEICGVLFTGPAYLGKIADISAGAEHKKRGSLPHSPIFCPGKLEENPTNTPKMPLLPKSDCGGESLKYCRSEGTLADQKASKKRFLFDKFAAGRDRFFDRISSGKPIFYTGPSSPPDTLPFSSYRDRIAQTKTRIILL